LPIKIYCLKLLPGLDSLLLAEKHTQDEGVKLSIKHFLDILENEGVKKIETIGKDFDPNLMEAINNSGR
jgi:molecular chaperone GrpE (heat shock protein)